MWGSGELCIKTAHYPVFLPLVGFSSQSIHKINLGKIPFDLFCPCFSLSREIRIKTLHLTFNSHSAGSPPSGLCLYSSIETRCGYISELHRCILLFLINITLVDNNVSRAQYYIQLLYTLQPAHQEEFHFICWLALSILTPPHSLPSGNLYCVLCGT